MKSSPLPALNLDAATALALPLAPVEANAQFRFCFRSPDGEATWLLARLCIAEAYLDDSHFYYCVVLRPEDGKTNQIFVTYDLNYLCEQRALDYWMTPAQAKRFEWKLFEQGFNDPEYLQGLTRFWRTEEGGKTTLLRFSAGGRGAIMGHENSCVAPFPIERFRWKRGFRRGAYQATNARFLRTTNANFVRQIRSRRNNEASDLCYALRWVALSEREKDDIAFACASGSWARLREVAAWVLMVRLAHQKRRCGQTSAWDLADDHIEVKGNPRLHADEALFDWRGALTEFFGAHGLGRLGVKVDALPHCVRNYIFCHEKSTVSVAPPTMHEALEAQLKLRDWTNAHFAPTEAARLLELLM